LKEKGFSFRASYSLLAARLGTSYHMVRRVEEVKFNDRYLAYFKEKRLGADGRLRDRIPIQAIPAEIAAKVIFEHKPVKLADLTTEMLRVTFERRFAEFNVDAVADDEIQALRDAYTTLRTLVLQKEADTEKLPETKRWKGDLVLPSTWLPKPPVLTPTTPPAVHPPVAPVDVGEQSALVWVKWHERYSAELWAEMETIHGTDLAVEEWSSRQQHPLSSALLKVLIQTEQIAVHADAGREVVRLDDEELVAALASAETSLDPIFARVGVTPDIAARYMLGMVQEGRGSTPAPEPEPEPEPEPTVQEGRGSTPAPEPESPSPEPTETAQARDDRPRRRKP
jgi:hypothetical protein